MFPPILRLNIVSYEVKICQENARAIKNLFLNKKSPRGAGLGLGLVGWLGFFGLFVAEGPDQLTGSSGEKHWYKDKSTVYQDWQLAKIDYLLSEQILHEHWPKVASRYKGWNPE